ncbi:hypothetical protein H6P81_009386 [Aristolochia fimbriata]|uniref:Uncharacterized protein n=1 Tax=Aristolochia fimbriata TaxID=158543 RepID=A0AAV7ELU6_ARIFI|nr:hypothetical protein H6P81_009386 [Aristolochia fimbriata]
MRVVMLRRFLPSQAPFRSRFGAHHQSRHVPGFVSPTRAGEKESQFEIDREKAREALKKLDEELQAMSQKQIAPKKRVSASQLDPYVDRDRMTGRVTEEMPEISGSYLTYTAAVLLLFTFLYNLVFVFYIKPAVDGTEEAQSTESRVPLVLPLQAAPPLADQN